MGVGWLRVVCPARLDMEKILKMATHEAADVVGAMEVFDRLEDSLADINFLAGTTARTGRKRRPTHSPRGIATEIACLGPETRAGILFGSEKWGLNNEHLGLCNSIVTIPTSDFSSIHLAQSVMILCYEIFVAVSGDLSIDPPRLASFREREGMFRHLHETFDAIGLFAKQTPAYWMRNARRFFNTKYLTARDVKVVRGFLRQVAWALRNAG